MAGASVAAVQLFAKRGKAHSSYDCYELATAAVSEPLLNAVNEPALSRPPVDVEPLSTARFVAGSRRPLRFSRAPILTVLFQHVTIALVMCGHIVSRAQLLLAVVREGLLS